MMLLVSVGAVVNTTLFAVVPNAAFVPPVVKVGPLPPLTTFPARLAKVIVLVWPVVFTLIVLPPNVEVRAPIDSLEAAAPFTVYSNVPDDRFIVRVPPRRLATTA